jgi:hypothetical protein
MSASAASSDLGSVVRAWSKRRVASSQRAGVPAVEHATARSPRPVASPPTVAVTTSVVGVSELNWPLPPPVEDAHAREVHCVSPAARATTAG